MQAGLLIILQRRFQILFANALDHEGSVISQALLKLILNSLISSQLWLKMSDLDCARPCRYNFAMAPFNEKQVGRYLRDKLAFDRLDEALEKGWLLKAICLEENIITDRLLSILLTKEEAASSRQSLGNLHCSDKESDYR